jgi:hypothetical protein
LILAVFAILLLSVIVGLLTPYSLQRKFVKLGVLEGRTKDEIIAAVGPPSEISVDGAGRTILKWRSRYFRIALGFDSAGKRNLSSPMRHPVVEITEDASPWWSAG